MLELMINYHKRKLDYMIERNYCYDKVLKQSQELDELINKWVALKLH